MRWITLVLVISFLAACGPAPQPTQSPVPSPVTAGASPLATPVIVPTPSRPDRATITGILLQDPASPRPVAEVILYLAQIHPNQSGTPMMAGFERTSSPRTQTDRSGRFVFANVPADKYGLILDRIDQAILLNDPNGKGDFIFQAKGGQVLDLGKLVYTSLPVD